MLNNIFFLQNRAFLR